MHPVRTCFVSGHDFSRAERVIEMNRASAPEGILDFGHVLYQGTTLVVPKRPMK